MSEKTEIIIDATNGILGRIASYAAKQALLGRSIVIVNCEAALLSGKRESIVREYGLTRRRGGSSLKGPFFPKIAEKVVKRTIRGMLSYTQQRGTDALKRVKCYNKLPKEYESAKKINLIKEMKTRTMNLAELERVI
ncbi:MAG: 50S ribosomal protein L13 [Nanoarchaeota archaeon]